MKSIKNFNAPAILGIALIALFLMAFVVPQDKKKGGPWTIPDKYKTMTNPNAKNTDLVNVGKTLYAKHCKACHGSLGKGDGPKAALLETFPGDFSDKTFQSNTKDGELYYMAIIGRNEMPNFESKVPVEEDRWALVMFLRTL
jgi:mono/diheme cytochrome c family protein